MRFRKSINICKGVRLNLSKSGASCTVGVKRLSVNVGKNGVYLNTGIPGTGLYDRHKLIGRSDRKRESAPKPDARDYALRIEENGEILVLNRSGRRVSEEEERKVRRTDWYREEAEALGRQFQERMEAQNDGFITIHQYAQSVSHGGAVEPRDVVERAVEDWLNDLELPVAFDVQYEYDEGDGSVMLDLDLPEIEDLPEEKAVALASGAVRAKDKTQKELREEYRTCVFGLAVFFASHIFRASAGIGDVLVSGYTQRRDQRTGELEDCYLYSIAFARSDFRTEECAREDPFEFCSRRRSRLNLLTSGLLKEIVPYTREEFAEIRRGG